MQSKIVRCGQCHTRYPIDPLQGKCSCGGTLLVEYDMERVKKSMTQDNLSQRGHHMWRYHELLPVQDLSKIVSLGEGWTPILRMEALEKRLPIRELYVKREEQNPTGSFKARGFSAAISLLNEREVKKVAVPSNGNAASALAAYAGRAGMESYVFVPKDTLGLIVEECLLYGAHTYYVDGYIHDGGRIIEDGKREQGWFNVGTLKEPGRVEGKKTMGMELAEQFGWELPDVIVYPTGGGSGVIGLWKAFHELKELGWIQGDLPRIVSVQEEGCDPLVNAMERGGELIPMSDEVTSSPTGMRVPQPPAGNLLVEILRETGGTAVAVTAEEIRAAQQTLGTHGLSSSPEGAATWAGLLHLCDRGLVSAKDRVVLFNTSHALKYLPHQPQQHIPVVSSYEEWLTLSKKR